MNINYIEEYKPTKVHVRANLIFTPLSPKKNDL